MAAAGRRKAAINLPSLDSISGDAPLRLKNAALLAFPDGSMTESGLSLEYKRGRLVCERIAGKLFTTLDAIKEMRRLCQDDQKVSVSTFASELAETRSGSSSTERSKSAQDALQMMSQGLIERSSTISQKDTSRTSGAATRKASAPQM